MKSSEGPESSTAKPKLPSERSAPAAPEPEWPPCPGARPGPARWGPLGLRPPGGGRGRPTWGAAQPRSPEIAEPGSATAAAKRRERTAETGGGWRLQSCCPGLGKSANYFQRTQTFLLPLLAAVPLALESFSGIPRGHWDAITSPGFLGGGSANFVDPGTRSARSAAEFSPRCSSARQDRDPGRPCLREKRLAPIPWVRLPSPPHPLQNWSQRLTSRPGSTVGRPLGGERQVCQASVACWIGARPLQQGGPLRSAPSADSRGDSRLLGGRAFWSRELAAAPGAQRHQGLGQRPQRPHPGSRPVGKRQSQSPPAQTPALGRSSRSLSRLREKEGKQRASRCPGGCAPRCLSGCAASRG